MHRFIATVFIGLHATFALAEGKTLLIGGGADPASAEVSIEKNVAWITRVLDERLYDNYEVVFGNGSVSDEPDVKTTVSNPKLIHIGLPLARVFGERKALLETYRTNTVATSPLSSTRQNVLDTLTESLESMSAGDGLLLIYNGHGGSGLEGIDQNHLRLWNKTRLTVTDLATTLAGQPRGTTFRFVLPQCYSGPFLRLISQTLPAGEGSAINTRRCGFVTVPHYRRSEGCTAVENEADYRDYSTYFFAALDGETRLGGPLAADPDDNSNGRVDFLEAHYYATSHSYSRDTPATTSEYFLEQWEPWYSKWHSHDLSGDFTGNEYAAMAGLIADKAGQPEGLSLRQRAVRAAHLRYQLENQIQELATEQVALKAREAELRATLQGTAVTRWPQLRHSYELAISGATGEEIERISAWLRRQSSYADLNQVQDRIDTIDSEVLGLERDIGMQLRILRFAKLSRLYQQLYRQGSEADITDYEALRECEAWEGFGKTGKSAG